MGEFTPLFGYESDPKAQSKFVSSLAKPTMADAGPGLEIAQHDVFLGHYLLKVNPHWQRGRQEIGSCVGWGWSLSCDTLAACDILLRGERESFGGRVLEAGTYGFSRVEARGQKSNNGGDGSYGAAAAKAVTKYGTLHCGQTYDGKSFEKSSGALERDWGRNGVPDDLESFAARHKVGEVTVVQNFNDVAKAISNGFPVAVCSGLGFNMTLRDGWLRQSGSWAHCQMICGVRFGDRPGAFVENSWGDCYEGTVDQALPVQFQRSGGWVDADVIDRLIAGDDSYALAGYQGFAPNLLPNWTGGWL
jgi:hypothetical protein